MKKPGTPIDEPAYLGVGTTLWLIHCAQLFVKSIIFTSFGVSVC